MTLDDNEKKEDWRGRVPESWLCVDCGINTAPGLLNRVELEKAIEEAKAVGKWDDDHGIEQKVDHNSEVYHVRDAVWKAAGTEPFGGCLCVGCLEKRLGRKLKPKDFNRHHVFTSFPATPRLIKRRG